MQHTYCEHVARHRCGWREGGVPMSLPVFARDGRGRRRIDKTLLELLRIASVLVLLARVGVKLRRSICCRSHIQSKSQRVEQRESMGRERQLLLEVCVGSSVISCSTDNRCDAVPALGFSGVSACGLVHGDATADVGACCDRSRSSMRSYSPKREFITEKSSCSSCSMSCSSAAKTLPLLGLLGSPSCCCFCAASLHAASSSVSCCAAISSRR